MDEASVCGTGNATSNSGMSDLPVAYAVLEILVGVVAIVGNVLVIVAFLMERKLRKLTNLYILSLAVADLLVGLVGIPSALLTKLGHPKCNIHGCLFMLALLVVLCTVSIMNLLAVSLDRYWAILHPLAYHRLMSGKAVAGIICCCWIIGFLIGLLPLMGWNNGPSPSGSCLFIPTMNYSYLVFLYFLTIVYPAILMAVFYGRIYIVVVKQSTRASIIGHDFKPSVFRRMVLGLLRQIAALEHQGNNSLSNSLSSISGNLVDRATPQDYRRNVGRTPKKEVKKAKYLFILVMLFMVCWVPLYTINCVQAFCKTCFVPINLLDTTIVISHANSAANPFIYAYHMHDFRSVLQDRICCCTKPKSVSQRQLAEIELSQLGPSKRRTGGNSLAARLHQNIMMRYSNGQSQSARAER